MPLPMNTTNTVSHQAAPTGARLSSKAVITTMSVSAWRVSKTHVDETRAVNAKHGTGKDEAEVRLRKICKHPALLEIYRLQTEARTTHYRLTLPAGDKGLRLLPVARQMEHAREMGEFQSRIDALLREFLAAYPAERAAAPARLKGLFVEKHWPATADEVGAKFSFTIRCLPVPDAGQWSEWLDEAAQAAQENLLERLREAISHVAERLTKPDAIFRDSLTANLAELLALVPDLNLRDDPRIAAIADKARELLAHDADTLREDPIARADVAATAAELTSMFNLTA
jgi:hypothetical protein